MMIQPKKAVVIHGDVVRISHEYTEDKMVTTAVCWLRPRDKDVQAVCDDLNRRARNGLKAKLGDGDGESDSEPWYFRYYGKIEGQVRPKSDAEIKKEWLQQAKAVLRAVFGKSKVSVRAGSCDRLAGDTSHFLYVTIKLSPTDTKRFLVDDSVIRAEVLKLFARAGVTIHNTGYDLSGGKDKKALVLTVLRPYVRVRPIAVTPHDNGLLVDIIRKPALGEIESVFLKTRLGIEEARDAIKDIIMVGRSLMVHDVDIRFSPIPQEIRLHGWDHP